ncbi:MAG: hypothetical protein FD133_607 [Erysipelotrichaceae bacterium]|nr:MAG: hypothetical protein FD179_1808 [Erysipelotrichaceae bacterium]TXT18853.1 MAG: hypothetical protein FD133_607 [Erysipelotrichaceae bacterium]
MSESIENIIIEEHQLFGNGHSMKFFDFLYKTFFLFFIIGLVIEVSTLTNSFIVDYKKDLTLFLSIWGNISTLITFGSLTVYNLVITSAIIKKDKQMFSALMLWRYPLATIILVVNYLIYISQYPDLSPIILPQTLSQSIIQMGIFVPIYIYLKKRMNKKYPADINQDLFKEHN